MTLTLQKDGQVVGKVDFHQTHHANHCWGATLTLTSTKQKKYGEFRNVGSAIEWAKKLVGDNCHAQSH